MTHWFKIYAWGFVNGILAVIIGLYVGSFAGTFDWSETIRSERDQALAQLDHCLLVKDKDNAQEFDIFAQIIALRTEIEHLRLGLGIRKPTKEDSK